MSCRMPLAFQSWNITGRRTAGVRAHLPVDYWLYGVAVRRKITALGKRLLAEVWQAPHSTAHALPHRDRGGARSASRKPRDFKVDADRLTGCLCQSI